MKAGRRKEEGGREGERERERPRRVRVKSFDVLYCRYRGRCVSMVGGEGGYKVRETTGQVRGVDRVIAVDSSSSGCPVVRDDDGSSGGGMLAAMVIAGDADGDGGDGRV